MKYKKDQLKNEKILYNPLDMIEDMIIVNNWEYDRRAEENLYVEVGGEWCDYQLSFSHSSELSLLQISCAYDIRIPDNKVEKVYPLLAKMNESLLIGHFEIWGKEGWPMYRHSLPVPVDKYLCIKQIEDISLSSIQECDRYYPAFQYVAWGGKSANEAMSHTMLKTDGEA